MTWNLEVAIGKNDITLDEIKNIINTLISNGFEIQQFNVTKYINPPE